MSDEENQLLQDLKDHVSVIGCEGCGADTLFQHMLEVELERSRTCIVLDHGLMEHATMINPNGETSGPTTFAVNLWVPATEQLLPTMDYEVLREAEHPNLKVHFYRLRAEELRNFNSAAWSFSLSPSQRHLFQIAKQKALRGEYGSISEAMEDFVRPRTKEELEEGDIGLADRRSKSLLMKGAFAQDRGIVDFSEREELGFEYLNVRRVLRSGGLHIFTGCHPLRDVDGPGSLTRTNTTILHELVTASWEENHDGASVYIPELWMLCSRRPPATLAEMSMATKYLLYLSMKHSRQLRLNFRFKTTSPGDVDVDLLSMTRPYVGRLNNVHDIKHIRARFEDPEDPFSVQTIRIIPHLPVNHFTRFEGDTSDGYIVKPTMSHQLRPGQRFLSLLKRGCEE